MFGVSLICFLIFNVVGGDPSFELAGKNASVEQIESIRTELGLNQNLFKQYLFFIKQIATFSWGHSWHTRESVSSMIFSGIGPSLSLTLPAFLLSFLASLFLALYSVRFKNTWKDRALTIFCLALMSISFLVYIILAQYFLAFKLSLFPVNGWDHSIFYRYSYLLLPWLIYLLVSLGPNILIYRAALIDETNQDYVVTGKAKGLKEQSLYYKHILRNAMIPIVTTVMLQLPFLFTGSLLLENFFGIPGIGGLLIQSIQHADFPVIKALTVTGSILYMAFNLFADYLYVLIDPRIDLR